MIVLLSIALGFSLQLITLAAKLLGGASFPGLRLILDFCGTITWSIVVCLGIGLGTMVMRSGAVLAGMLGAVFAPLGLVAAKTVQKAIGLLIGLPADSITTTVVVLGLIKAIEYGFLGALLAVMIKKEDQHFKRYVMLGLGTGVVFGTILVIASARMAESNGTPLIFPQLAGKTVNEVLFPLGCALVIYAIQHMSRRISVVKEQA